MATKKFSAATSKVAADFTDPTIVYLMGVEMSGTPAPFKATAFDVVREGLTVAWSGTGVATTPLLVNVTADPGPAAAASKLLDLQVAGSSKASFNKSGALSIPAGLSSATSLNFGTANTGWYENGGFLAASNNGTPMFVFGGGVLRVTSSYTFGWASGSAESTNIDVALARDTTDILAQRRATNGNTFKVYRTFTSSSTFERGTFGWHDSSSDTGTVGNVLRIGTEKGSVGGTARDVALITNGTARVTLDATTGVPTIAADQIRVTTTKTPSSATDTGVAGSICWDASYLYVCTATNVWRRVAHATW